MVGVVYGVKKRRIILSNSLLTSRRTKMGQEIGKTEKSSAIVRLFLESGTLSLLSGGDVLN